MSTPITYIAWFSDGYVNSIMIFGLTIYGPLVVIALGLPPERAGILTSSASSRFTLGGMIAELIGLLIGKHI